MRALLVGDDHQEQRQRRRQLDERKRPLASGRAQGERPDDRHEPRHEPHEAVGAAEKGLVEPAKRQPRGIVQIGRRQQRHPRQVIVVGDQKDAAGADDGGDRDGVAAAARHQSRHHPGGADDGEERLDGDGSEQRQRRQAGAVAQERPQRQDQESPRHGLREERARVVQPRARQRQKRGGRQRPALVDAEGARRAVREDRGQPREQDQQVAGERLDILRRRPQERQRQRQDGGEGRRMRRHLPIAVLLDVRLRSGRKPDTIRRCARLRSPPVVDLVPLARHAALVDEHGVMIERDPGEAHARIEAAARRAPIVVRQLEIVIGEDAVEDDEVMGLIPVGGARDGGDKTAARNPVAAGEREHHRVEQDEEERLAETRPAAAESAGRHAASTSRSAAEVRDIVAAAGPPGWRNR